MPLLTIEEMRDIAKQRGGLCLSSEYMGNKVKLKWQCSDKHVWKAIPQSIKRGCWCPHCVGNVKLTIAEMKDIAQKRGGRCLSKEYINYRTKLIWECAKGHQWKASPDKVKQGTWCPICSKIKRN
jgi:hypothetical protein